MAAATARQQLFAQPGRSICAEEVLLETLSEGRGATDAVEAVILPLVDQLAVLTSVTMACALLGRARASHYRAQKESERRAALPFGPELAPVRPPRPTPPNALSTAEHDRVLAVLTEPRFADKAVAQTWATLLDEGTYLCSMSTMHRILRAHGLAGERRRQATHPPRKKPELLATRASQAVSEPNGICLGEVAVWVTASSLAVTVSSRRPRLASAVDWLFSAIARLGRNASGRA